MNAIRARVRLLTVLLAAAAAAGCSSSGSSQAAPAASPTGGGDTASASTGAARSATSDAAASGSSQPAARPTSVPPVPSVTASSLSGVSYAPASATARSKLSAATKASGGLLQSGSVKTIRVGGDDVGGVGVYTLKPGSPQSATFRSQYLVQLVNAVAGGTSSPRFVQAMGRVLALSTGRPAVAGWFEGQKVVLVYRQGDTPDLTALALGVRAAGVSG